MSENNEEQLEVYSKEDVAVTEKIEDEFDGDKFESEYRRKIEEREALKRAERRKLIFIILGAALFGVLVALFCFTDKGIIGVIVNTHKRGVTARNHQSHKGRL